MDINEELVDYQRKLERGIANKEYFLEKAKAALEVEKNTPDTLLKDDIGLWNSFMEKPMFFPDHSDPFGWSLASFELRKRLETSEEYLEQEPLDQLKDMLSIQEKLNKGIEILESLLKLRLKDHHEALENRRSGSLSAGSCNAELWNILNLLVRNFVAVDLSPEGSDIDSVADAMLDVLKRLMKADGKVPVEDFHGQCSGLYRILWRAKFIRKSKDAHFIELVDFSEMF
ncbi:LAFA_0F10572g1_1 [Lachancea sp. 'fantastica']|nr:LAFA_0F10572g1_1 [Lachancea sp. 'fantastica']